MIITVLLGILVLALAVWIVQQASVPQPFIWAAYAVCFILAVLLFLHVAGIAVP